MTKVSKDMKFDEILNNRVDMERVDLEAVRPWISRQIIGLIKHEDEVLIDYICNQLEPQYPDPREIQTNLSGFLSYKNARIFTSELWKELLESMDSNKNIRSESKRLSNDKIRSFPRLGPSESKHINNEIIVQKKSIEKKEIQYSSQSSRSESFSSQSDHRTRSRSRRRSKYDHNSRLQRRSYTKSSSKYSPYTRYSRYDDSSKSRCSTCCSKTNRHITSRRKSSSSSSSSEYLSKSSIEYGSNKANQKSNVLCNSKRSRSIVHSVPSKSPIPNTLPCDTVVQKANVDEFNSKIPIQNNRTFEEKSPIRESHGNGLPHVKFMSPKSLSKSSQSIKRSPESSTSSESIDFVSPRNAQLKEISPLSDSSSSSEYSIEYMDKSLVLQSQQIISDSETEYETEIEWITNEEYMKIVNKQEMSEDSLSSSPSDSWSSEYSMNDIEWVEEHHLEELSDDYLRI